jgi:hypothetical protein|tara:strand:+ start:271 stop:450 length:180 start_codon:yes stop_codon:yes gene_type:complete
MCIFNYGQYYTGVAMKLKKEWGEWFWVSITEAVISPRFTTKSEACYWLIEFELGEDDEH